MIGSIRGAKGKGHSAENHAMPFPIIAVFSRYCCNFFPLRGFQGNLFRKEELNSKFGNYSWFQVREEGTPLVASLTPST